MKAEYLGNKGCLQRDNAEREEYAGARSIDSRETAETDGASLAGVRQGTPCELRSKETPFPALRARGSSLLRIKVVPRVFVL